MGKVFHWNWSLTIWTNGICTTPGSVLENETHELLWNFEIQTNHLILARQPDLIIINKKERTRRIVDFAVPVDHRVKLNECEKRDKCHNLARELKKTVEYERDDHTNCNWCFWYSHQKIGTRTGGLGNKRTGRDCLNYYIIEISQNTEKSPGDLRRLAVSQTPVENHQLTLMWKTLKEKDNSNTTNWI